MFPIQDDLKGVAGAAGQSWLKVCET